MCILLLINDRVDHHPDAPGAPKRLRMPGLGGLDAAAARPWWGPGDRRGFRGGNPWGSYGFIEGTYSTYSWWLFKGMLIFQWHCFFYHEWVWGYVSRVFFFGRKRKKSTRRTRNSLVNHGYWGANRGGESYVRENILKAIEVIIHVGLVICKQIHGQTAHQIIKPSLGWSDSEPGTDWNIFWSLMSSKMNPILDLDNLGCGFWFGLSIMILLWL